MPAETTGAAPHSSRCPGCGLLLPADSRLGFDGYFNCSPECWSVYGEVLGAQFGNAVIFGHVHQMTVDAYAVQHAGGPHPDKSIAVHLVGLHLAFNVGIPQPQIAAYLQQLVAAVDRWPHYPPPVTTNLPTVFDIALADDPLAHIKLAKQWAQAVWQAWTSYHPAIATLTQTTLSLYPNK